MAPSPGGCSGTAALPELPLWFGTCPPSDWRADKPPHHTNEEPTQSKKETNTNFPLINKDIFSNFKHEGINSRYQVSDLFLFYLLKAHQQVSCTGERSSLGAYGSADDITEMSQLVAALDDECQSVVVVSSQLVTMQNHNLGTSHLFLRYKNT